LSEHKEHEPNEHYHSDGYPKKRNYCSICGFKYPKNECKWGHHDLEGGASGGWCVKCGHFEQCG